MPLVNKVTHIFEPTDLQCGQAVLSMLSGESMENIIKLVGTERETNLRQMKEALKTLGISFGETREEAFSKSDLPPAALLSLETPRCWHWSLYFEGTFFDPEHGVLDDFPQSKRKYYWKINK